MTRHFIALALAVAVGGQSTAGEKDPPSDGRSASAVGNVTPAPSSAITGPFTGHPSVDFFGLEIAGFTGSAGTPSNIGAAMPGMPGLSAAIMQDETSVEGEKSPWLAAGMSLLIPGTGELYAGSYLKAAIFFIVDVGLWTGAYMYDQDGDQMTTDYQAFANQHWSAVRYTDWTAGHIGSLNPDIQMSGDEYLTLIYVDDETDCPPPFSCIDWVELNTMERDIAMGRLNGYTHTLPYYGEQQYYELIGKYEQFSRGWDDSGTKNPELENAVPIRNTSLRFDQYSDMRAEANNQYSTAETFVSIAVVNRVLSAVDAFWSVSRYNKALRAELRMRMMMGRAGPVAVPTASVSWKF